MTPVYPSPMPPSIAEHASDAGAMRPGDLPDRVAQLGSIVELMPDERIVDRDQLIADGAIARMREPEPLFTSAMSFTDAGTFALLTAVVLSAILIIGTCERDSDVRSTSCAIRWRHAITVQDSLIVAGHCGSDGLARGAKP